MTQSIQFIPTIIVLIYGQRLISNGMLSIGELIALTTYLQGIYSPLNLIAANYQSFQKSMININRHESFINRFNYKSVDDKLVLTDIESIELKEINFSYNNSIVLDNLSLKINKGEIVQIVGGNGAGKTTIIDLIFELVKPSEGAIEINGVDVGNYSFDSKYSCMSIVPQNTILFNDSIFNNIILDRNLCKSQIDKVDNELDFLMTIKNGSQDSFIKEHGKDLSAGQSKKISILRGLVDSSYLLVLDEPFSNLDKESKKRLKKYLRTLSENKIIIIVSHEEEIDFSDQRVCI